MSSAFKRTESQHDDLAGVGMDTPVCVIVTRFSEGQPGFLDFSYRMKALSRAYHLVIVSNTALIQPELQMPGARYVVLGDAERRIDWLRYLWRCSRLLRQLRPAVAVLLHSTVAPLALLAGPVPTAVYWNEHPTHFAAAPEGFAPFRRAMQAAWRQLLFKGACNADIVMPIGEAQHDDLLSHGCPQRRVRLIPMGVDPAFSVTAAMRPAQRADAPLELIYIGSVSIARGRDVMLDALHLANRSGVIARLTIIGASEPEQVRCAERAAQLHLEGQLTVQGRIDGKKIPGALRQADIGLCLWEDRPWWRFNPPTKLFEYLVAGLPVLASDIATHTRDIQHWRNGLIFDYNSEALADAIRALWQRRAELPLLKCEAWASGRQYLWPKIEPVFLDAIAGVAQP